MSNELQESSIKAGPLSLAVHRVRGGYVISTAAWVSSEPISAENLESVAEWFQMLAEELRR